MTNDSPRKALLFVRNETALPTEEQLRASERYFQVWSKQRDAARRHIITAGLRTFSANTEEELFSEIGRRLSQCDKTSNPIIGLLGRDADPDQYTLISSLIALLEAKIVLGDTTEKRAIGTARVLAATLFGPVYPIALHEEAERIKNDTKGNFIRTIPPVVVATMQGVSHHISPEFYYIGILGDPYAYHVATACRNAPEILTKLSAVCDYRNEQGNFAGLTSEESQAQLMRKNRELARAFWRWRDQPERKLPQKTRNTLTEGSYGKSPSEIMDRLTKRLICNWLRVRQGVGLSGALKSRASPVPLDRAASLFRPVVVRGNP